MSTIPSRFLPAVLFVALTMTIACNLYRSADPAPDVAWDVGGSDAGVNDTGIDTGGDDANVTDTLVGEDTGSAPDVASPLDVASPSDVASSPDTGTSDVAEDTGGDVILFGPTQECNPTFGAAEACGGSPVGTWEIDNVCTDVDLTEQISSFCAGTTVSRLDVRTSGTVVYTETTYSTDVSGFAEVDLTVPTSLCTLGGCDFLASQIESNLGDAQATCAPGAAGACDCTVRLTLSVVESGTYVANSASGVITYDNGDTVHYCIDNGALIQREFGDGVEFEITQVFVAQ